MSAVISLRKIDEYNYDAVCKLMTREGQTISEGPAKYLVKSQFRFYWTRAIYADETPVGFMLVNMELEDEFPWLNVLMIDKAFQGKGYGKAAVGVLFDLLKGSVKHLHVCTHETKGARHFYEKLGFCVLDRRMGASSEQLVLVKKF